MSVITASPGLCDGLLEDMQRSRRVLAYLDRMVGPSLFLGAFEGSALEVEEQLKRKWRNAWRTQRIELREVASD